MDYIIRKIVFDYNDDGSRIIRSKDIMLRDPLTMYRHSIEPQWEKVGLNKFRLNIK